MADETRKSYNVEIYVGNPNLDVSRSMEVQDHVKDRGLPIMRIRAGDSNGTGCDCMYGGIEDKGYAAQLVNCINELQGIAAKVVEVNK